MAEDKTHEIGSKHDSPQNKSVRSKQQREAPQKGSSPSYHRGLQVKIQRCLSSTREYYICLRKGNYLDIFRYSTVVQEPVLSNPVLDILIDICTSTHSFKSRRLFPILPLATKPYLSRSFLQEKQFGATLDGVQIWGACALLSHVISPFFKQKNLDDTKHGPSIIWSGRVVNEWHQMCHNGVTLIIFLGACAERSYFSAADASKYKMRLRGTTPW